MKKSCMALGFCILLMACNPQPKEEQPAKGYDSLNEEANIIRLDISSSSKREIPDSVFNKFVYSAEQKMDMEHDLFFELILGGMMEDEPSESIRGINGREFNDSTMLVSVGGVSESEDGTLKQTGYYLLLYKSDVLIDALLIKRPMGKRQFLVWYIENIVEISFFDEERRMPIRGETKNTVVFNYLISSMGIKKVSNDTN